MFIIDVAIISKVILINCVIHQCQPMYHTIITSTKQKWNRMIKRNHCNNKKSSKNPNNINTRKNFRWTLNISSFDILYQSIVAGGVFPPSFESTDNNHTDFTLNSVLFPFKKILNVFNSKTEREKKLKKTKLKINNLRHKKITFTMWTSHARSRKIPYKMSAIWFIIIIG